MRHHFLTVTWKRLHTKSRIKRLFVYRAAVESQRVCESIEQSGHLKSQSVARICDHEMRNLSVHPAGGFEQFRQSYPRLCGTEDDEDRSTPLCLEVGRLSLRSTVDEQPTEERPSLRELITSSPPTLVAPYLYIGNAQNALDRDCLRTHDIRYIVNVTSNVPNRSVTQPATNVTIALCVGEEGGKGKFSYVSIILKRCQ